MAKIYFDRIADEEEEDAEKLYTTIGNETIEARRTRYLATLEKPDTTALALLGHLMTRELLRSLDFHIYNNKGTHHRIAILIDYKGAPVWESDLFKWSSISYPDRAAAYVIGDLSNEAKYGKREYSISTWLPDLPSEIVLLNRVFTAKKLKLYV